jgi:hypothetical protein
MSYQDFPVKLPVEMIVILHDMAQEADVSVGQLIRSTLASEISRRRNARPPNRADERLIAPLRARLAPILGTATNWRDVQAQLKRIGYILRPAGGGLALHNWPEDDRLCKASELGFSYSKLMHRFGAPFPNHPHRHLVARHIGPEPDNDLDVIEPF